MGIISVSIDLSTQSSRREDASAIAQSYDRRTPESHGPNLYDANPSRSIAAGIKAEEWNGFHDFILWDELYRGAPSISSAFIGLVVGAPPIKQYASPALQAKILPEILSGRKRICLAITEPSAGSDVRGITTTAERTPDGKYFIVNGEKKWITNGLFSDYFCTAVRTGGPGAGGMSMLLIPRDIDGIMTRKIEIGAGGMGATTYITFEDVKVTRRVPSRKGRVGIQIYNVELQP